MRSGSWVEVRTPGEIAGTLDAGGALDGLPFMAEMLEFCGRRFRVARRVEKTCVEFPGGKYPILEFRNNDVVLLEGLRCSGAEHGGCQRGCYLFWKTAWVREVASGEPASSTRRDLADALVPAIAPVGGPSRYRCQSTDLAGAVHREQIGRSRILMKCVRDIRSGSRGVIEMVPLVAGPLFLKVRDRILGRPKLVGPLRKTPVGDLDLRPGELVEVRPLGEIRQTLDRNGRNRGLVFDIELGKYCGKRFRVRNRLERMISETTGEMRKVEGTVILEGNLCMCARSLGGCPRMEFTYWREAWLKRV
jgi:hypothetical protein